MADLVFGSLSAAAICGPQQSAMVLNSWMFLTSSLLPARINIARDHSAGRTSACTRNNAAKSASSEEPRARSSWLCPASAATGWW